MNIQLFTSDDARENILKHVRGGSGLCYAPPQLESVMGERSNTYSSLSRGNIPASGRLVFGNNSRPCLQSPLFSFPTFVKSLSPSQTPNIHLTSEYAQELIDELNTQEEH